MPHVLRSPDGDREVSVGSPAAGQVLLGNSIGRWQPGSLESSDVSFGTPAEAPLALDDLEVTGPTVADYAIADVTQTDPFGFVAAEEARTVLSVVAYMDRPLRARVIFA